MKSKWERILDLVDNLDVEKYEFTPEEEGHNPGYTFQGPDGHDTLRHAIILKCPTYKNSGYEIIYLNVDDKQKELLFRILDAELHEKTAKALADEIANLEYKVYRAEEELDYIKEAAVTEEL